MSETTTRTSTPGSSGATPPTEHSPAPPGTRRRPAITVVALVLAAVGAVMGWTLWTSEDSTIEVLAAQDTISRGEVIDKADLAVRRVPADLGWSVVEASRLDDVVGQRAAYDVAAGTAVAMDAVSDANVPADGSAVVGVALETRQAPGMPLQVGDRVAVVVTPAGGGEVSSEAVPESTAAEVAGVQVDPETGNTVLDLLVPEPQSALLAARVATGNFAVVLQSRDR
ncbi:SAF domain-containing protein [Isoptericola sp. NPDC019482]|uniref:SAF domain-containing protein n=1 Tax=Isoptericola sp. NPDC019482 TaxID=3154688 RepID=UPI0034973F0C